MYRSGDLVSIRYDGVIEFLGRQDNQVKVRGYRVELGEIEVCLQQHPAVRHAVAIALENDRAEKAIHTFWTAKAGAIAESDELLQFAGQRLPSFMMPASLTHVDSLPLTANGKVDRTQLLAMAMREISRKDSYVPPSDVLEVELIGIWEEVLRTKRVGIRDDFFTLGGHSLLAARMFTRIEERLRKTIPLATIFAAPTIEKLAQVIRTEGWTSHWSVLVPIQQGGSRPPLFLMHGLHGNVLTYYGLRHHMPPDQPVYGVQAEGLHSGRASFVSLPEMAEYYIREIRSVQPSGPYFIGGFSGGGLLAYEMAQQLSAAGERIQFLALFDSYVEVAGGYWLKSFSSRRALRMSLLALRANWQMTRKHGLSYVVGWKAKNANINLRIMLWQLTGKLFAKTRSGRHLRASLLNPAAAFTYAIRVYVPKPYSGPAVLFRAPSSGFENSGLSEGWKNYITGNLEIQVIEGLHQDIFREPHIGRLAEQLTQTLESAQADQNDAGKTK
jgi:thioesterase domain-containing protein